MRESTKEVCPFEISMIKRNQHDKAWKMHALVRLLIFNYVM